MLKNRIKRLKGLIGFPDTRGESNHNYSTSSPLNAASYLREDHDMYKIWAALIMAAYNIPIFLS